MGASHGNVSAAGRSFVVRGKTPDAQCAHGAHGFYAGTGASATADLELTRPLGERRLLNDCHVPAQPVPVELAGQASRG